jgi:cytochrome c oxidase cbb3-type subunit 3
MKLWVGTISAAMLTLAAVAWVPANGDAAKGKEIFSHRCAMCHGNSGEGKEAIAKMFHVKMLPFESKEVQSKSDAVLRKDILEGNGKMKPVKLSDQEVNDVVAFLRTLPKKK